MQLLWDGLASLVTAEVHVDLALAVWLRWAAASREGVRPSQKILGNDSYWALIQVWSLAVRLYAAAAHDDRDVWPLAFPNAGNTVSIFLRSPYR